ncbi:hypothetical protein GYMLUDRAFT_68384 [Collybiopsis luxurians FD-317 M1]|nr:hypothetical protein GYMLUDRAFT_68384 [Collybiopsis luxurians FD-317 M1]
MGYNTSDVLVRSLMSGAWFIVVILVLWCVTALAGWDSSMEERKISWDWFHQVVSLVFFGVWLLVEGAIKIISRYWRVMPSQSFQV